MKVHVNLELYKNLDVFQTCEFQKKKKVWRRMRKNTTLSGRLWERKGKKFLISFIMRMYVNQNATLWRVFPRDTYDNVDYWSMGYFCFSLLLHQGKITGRIAPNLEDILGMV